MIDRYDIIIIGTGAGGGTLVHALAGSGARILVIERGDFVPREEENWDPEAVWKHLRYRIDEHWLDERGRAFRPYTHYCVGGNTKFWGSVLYRLRREDFEEPPGPAAGGRPEQPCHRERHERGEQVHQGGPDGQLDPDHEGQEGGEQQHQRVTGASTDADRLTTAKTIGLVAAFAGTAVAFGDGLRLPTRRELIGASRRR